jgi:hypothetical protein
LGRLTGNLRGDIAGKYFLAMAGIGEKLLQKGKKGNIECI